jgi:hypothetical protein
MSEWAQGSVHKMMNELYLGNDVKRFGRINYIQLFTSWSSMGRLTVHWAACAWCCSGPDPEPGPYSATSDGNLLELAAYNVQMFRNEPGQSRHHLALCIIFYLVYYYVLVQPFYPEFKCNSEQSALYGGRGLGPFSSTSSRPQGQAWWRQECRVGGHSCVCNGLEHVLQWVNELRVLYPRWWTNCI